jgi:E3 Ubiquitin ligase
LGGIVTFEIHGKPAEVAVLVFFALAAVVSFCIWLDSFRKLLAIQNTPTSKIASAAQGYVELAGIGKAISQPLLSKLRQAPCIWYRYEIEKERNRYVKDEKGNITIEKDWETVDRGESKECFFLDDGSGVCTIDPSGADIDSTDSTQWMEASVVSH